MHLVEQRLISFTYHFRRLTWREEARLSPKAGEDIRNLFLIHALHDVSGHKPQDLEEAREIIHTVPRNVRRGRLFVTYRGSLPDDRYNTCMGLYQAPDHAAYNRRLVDEGDQGVGENPRDREIARRFGAQEALEAWQMEQALATQAMLTRKG